MARAAALVLLALVAVAAADKYAVLVCGSHGYGNYRHHADVCHAYNTLIARGVPASNIITFLYDDVANDLENPFRGQLFNQPSDGPGVDVYKNCVKDYTHFETTGDNFLAVLKGDAARMKNKGTGRVLNSTKDDDVFINFVDHGGVGIIAMGAGGLVHADELIDTLKYMNSNNMYKRLVFYMEACESGSMFQDLPSNINIYATTAANAEESSWGTYCPPQDMVDGKELRTCLGDLYSVNWMQDADKQSSFSETLEQQYEVVKQETNRSHVMQFGDLSWTSELINDFLGGHKAVVPIRPRPASSFGRNVESGESKPSVHVDSRQASTHSLFHRFMGAEGERRQKLGAELMAEIQSQMNFDAMFDTIKSTFFQEQADLATADLRITEWACYHAANDAIQADCGGYTDYSLKYSRVVVNMCETSKGDTDKVVAAIRAGCAAF